MHVSFGNVLATIGLLLPVLGCAPTTGGTAPTAGPAASTTPAITEADLRTRLYIFADDSMQGRRSGTPGGVKGTDYIAAEARRLGLEPAGDNGTYFQQVPLIVRTLDPNASFTVDGQTFRAWDDLIPRDQGKGARPIDGAPVIYGGVQTLGADRMIPADQAAGKLVVITVGPDSTGAPSGTVVRASTTQRFAGAVGIAVATLDHIGATERITLEENSATLALESGPPLPAFMYVTSRVAAALLGADPAGLAPGTAGRTVRGTVAFVDSPAPYPVRNVVARLPGSDPALRGQVVAIGAHNDHDGIFPSTVDHDSLRAFNRLMRPEGANTNPGEPTQAQWARIRAILDSLRRLRPPRRDSVMNGADDDGSGSTGVLEIAEALARGEARPRRSLLFVWHAAEELGLLGSDWFTRHPTVPRDSIVAQLNIDMIGRGGPTDLPAGGPSYIQLIGSRRLSTELGDLVERVNREGRHGFDFDYRFDADGHTANYYCRSDHYMYARFGIPIVFFTTGSHQDYHQVTDEPQYIDYAKMARVTRFIADVGLATANLDHRPVVDKPKPDPEGVCKQ